MKKTLNILIGGLFVLFFVMALLPTFNHLYFYIKHLSLYLFASIISIKILLYFYNKIVYNNLLIKNKLKVLQVFTLLFIGGFLYLIGNIQMLYIDKYESPNLYSCTYYDEYSNVIYSSQFYGVCPELDNVIQTDNTISFSVTETSTRYNSSYTVNGVFVEGQNLYVYRLTEISIKYNTDNQIEEFSILSSTNIESDTQGEYHKKYYSLKKEIKNTYTDNSFESVYDYYFFEAEEYNFTSLENIQHYQFSEDDKERKIVTSEISYDSEGVGQITLSLLTNTDEIPKVFASGTLTSLDYGDYSTLIDIVIQEDTRTIFEGNHYKTYISDNKIKKLNYYYDTIQAFSTFTYDNTQYNLYLQKEEIYIDYGYGRVDIFSTYEDPLRGILIIEKPFTLTTVEKIEYGYLTKEYYKNNYCKTTDCSDVALLHPDWYYWNSVGLTLSDLYDYERTFYFTSLDKYSVIYNNPLISIYYE